MGQLSKRTTPTTRNVATHQHEGTATATASITSTSRQQPSISASKTMPQLSYTRQDIHEQYLSTNSLRRAQQQQQQRARSSGSTRLRSSNEGAKENKEDYFGDPQVQREQEHEQGGHERGKRSRSLSLFSNCFSISNISSMLSSSSSATQSNHQETVDTGGGAQRVSRRRAFLAQLGLASGQPSSKKRRRPISASQTAGNLQQVADGGLSGEETTSTNNRLMPKNDANPSSRKHVSFGAGGSRTGQGQTCPIGSQSNQQKSIPESEAAAPQISGQMPIQQQPTSASAPAATTTTAAATAKRPTTSKNPISSGSNNVIIRNYQANISAHHLMQNPTGCGAGLEAEETNANASCQSTTAATSALAPNGAKKPPIYLVSMVPNSNLPPKNKTAPRPISSKTNQSYSAMMHQQQQSRQQGASRADQQQTHLPERHNDNQPRTIYKSLPPVPMRSIATQTVITRHHLMELANPLIPGTGEHHQHTPQRHQMDASQMIIDPAGNQVVTCPVERRAPPSKMVQGPNAKACSKTTVDADPGTTPNTLRDDNREEDRWSASSGSTSSSSSSSTNEDEDEDANLAEGRSATRHLATYSSGSSASSSASSLVGHDSTLLAAAKSTLLQDETPPKMLFASAAPALQPVGTSIIESGIGEGAKSPKVGRLDSSRSDSNAVAADIEPPSEFAATTTTTTTTTTSQSAREPADTLDTSFDATSAAAAGGLSGSLGGDSEAAACGATEWHNKAEADDDDERWAPSPPSLSEASSQTTTDGALAARIIDLGRKLSSGGGGGGGGSGVGSGSSVLVGGSCRPSVCSSASATRNNPISGGRRPKWASSDSAAANYTVGQLMAANSKGAASGATSQLGAAEQVLVKQYDEMVKAARNIDQAGGSGSCSTDQRLLTASSRLDEFIMSNAANDDDDDVDDDGDRQLQQQRAQSRASSGNSTVGGPNSSASSTRRSAEKRRDDFLMFATESAATTTPTESCDFEQVASSSATKKKSAKPETGAAESEQLKSRLLFEPDSSSTFGHEHPAARSNDDPDPQTSSSRVATNYGEQQANGGGGVTDNQADGSTAAEGQSSSSSTTGCEHDNKSCRSPLEQVAARGRGSGASSPTGASSLEAANGADERTEQEVEGGGTTTTTIIKRDYNGDDHKICPLMDTAEIEETETESVDSMRARNLATQPLAPKDEDTSSAGRSQAEELVADAKPVKSDLEQPLTAQKQQQHRDRRPGEDEKDLAHASFSRVRASYEPSPEAVSATFAVADSCSPVPMLDLQQEQDVATTSSTSSQALAAPSAATLATINSPPTTVTELEQDDEVPSSLVEIYRDRLAQIQQLADSVLDSLMEECLTYVGSGHNLTQDLLAEVCEPDTRVVEPKDLAPAPASATATTTTTTRPGRDRSLSSSMSSETATTTFDDTSSTSASGHSRPCCHPKSVPHKPLVPEKPAHLHQAVCSNENSTNARDGGRDQVVVVRGQPEAAAAIAVTATSIAAASLLHTTYSQPQVVSKTPARPDQVSGFSDAETNRDNTGSGSSSIHDGLELGPSQDGRGDLTEEPQKESPESANTKLPPMESGHSQEGPIDADVAELRKSLEAGGDESESAATSGLSHLATLGSSQKSALASPTSIKPQETPIAASEQMVSVESSESVGEENEAEQVTAELDLSGPCVDRRPSHVELSTLSELSEEMSVNGGQITISSNPESAIAVAAGIDHEPSAIATQVINKRAPERQISTQSNQSSIPDSQNEFVAQLTNETSSPQPISSCSPNNMFDMAGGSGIITQVEPNAPEQQWSRSSSIQLRQAPVSRSGRVSVSSPLSINEVATPGDQSTQGGLTNILRTGMDCPYVSDMIPPSPPPPQSPLPVTEGANGSGDTSTGSSKVPPLACAHHRSRLSHDDTLEAIEDDVEGEEQEMMQQVEGGNNGRHQLFNAFNIDPPPEFALSVDNEPIETCATPPASLNSLGRDTAINEEENEDEDGGDDEEESSISVSQRHGIVVFQQHEQQQKRESQRSPTPTQTTTPTPETSSHETEKSEQEVATASTQEQEIQPKHVASIQPFKASQSASGDSITHAMLEHMSRNQTQRIELEEPAPDLEQSRPLQRQQSTTSDSDPANAGQNQDLSSTGTIKRRRTTDTQQPRQQMSDSQEARVAEVIKPQAEKVGPARGRGPPLGQTKVSSSQYNSRQKHQQTQDLENHQGKQSPVDSSICSTCSCLMASEELSDAQLAELAATESGEVIQHSSTRRQVSRGWMSHDDGSVFTENYWLTHWLYISEHDESKIWSRAIDVIGGMEATRTEDVPDNISETGSTKSERNFSSKYRSTTRKMIHRRATIEMYNRLMNNSLRSEKRIEISRSDGEFGFRIHGSRPVVVSAIERGTSAETCGLQVGDMLFAINGTKIIDMSHSDVVKLAHRADPSSLILDLVPSNDFLKMNKYNKSGNKLYQPIMTGYLLRLSPSTVQPLLNDLQEKMSRLTDIGQQERTNKMNEVIRLAWRKRYFVLRNDNCLFWYKCESDIEPCGGINLQGFCASLAKEFDEPTYVLRLFKQGRLPYFLGTNNVCDIQTWIDSLNKAATDANQNDLYMERSMTLARCPPDDIPDPDCTGYLHKYSHKRNGGSHWIPGYFVLKDTCLYMFRTQQSELASQASAIYYLQGYRVKSKRNERGDACCVEPSKSKRHTFELIPHNKRPIKTLFLMASTETDMKRWIAALEYSIDRWIEIE